MKAVLVADAVEVEMTKRFTFEFVEVAEIASRAHGLVEEVQNLARRQLSKTALQAVGYKEVMGCLRGDYSLDKAKELVKLHTRHLAKRQWTWFKREEGISWIDVSTPESLEAAVVKILEAAAEFFEK